jgi:hypothetical protein
MGELITHRDISDDLADLSLTQARMIAALDDMPARHLGRRALPS